MNKTHYFFSLLKIFCSFNFSRVITPAMKIFYCQIFPKLRYTYVNCKYTASRVYNNKKGGRVSNFKEIVNWH